MNRAFAFVIVMMVALNICSSPGAQEPQKKKQSPVIGTWEVVPEPFSPTTGEQVTVTFAPEGKLVYRLGKGPAQEGSYRVDDTKSPPEIDLITPARAKNARPPLLGIYKIEKDTFTIYTSEKQRPKKLQADRTLGVMEIKYMRKK